MWGWLSALSGWYGNTSYGKTSRAEASSYALDVNTGRDYVWPIVTALAINTSLQPTIDENDQTGGQLTWSAVVTVFFTFLYFVYLLINQQKQAETFKAALTNTLEECADRNMLPALVATLGAIPAYNYAGFYFDLILIKDGVNPDLATILLASAATGYAEQGAQYFLFTKTKEFVDWYRQHKSGYESIGSSRGYLQAFGDILLDLAKTLLSSFISLRALGSFYPGGVWNLVFMGLTIAFGMTDETGVSVADFDSAAYWAKLLLVVAPLVALSVRTSNILVVMSTEKLEQGDAFVVKKLTELGSGVKTSCVSLFFKTTQATEMTDRNQLINTAEAGAGERVFAASVPSKNTA